MEHEAITRIKEEFARHVGSGETGTFRATAETNAAFTKLIRDLEKKRQGGVLMESEKTWLNDADVLLDNIATFNRQAANNSASVQQKNSSVYNLNSQERRQDEGRGISSTTIPQITDDQAEQIIAELNKQFEAKVLKKKIGMVTKKNSQALPDFSTVSDDKAKGADLHGFMSAMRTEEPNLPFLDEDSHMDLAKIKRGRK